MTNAMQKNNGQSVNGLVTAFDQILSQNLRRFFDANFWDSENPKNVGSVPVNVRETEQQYEVDVIAPGCKKEDFRIQIQENELSISLNRSHEKETNDEKAGWVRNEFVQRSFSRSFTLDETVNTSEIKARYEDGVLKLILPKNEKAKPRMLSIEVK